MDVDEFNPHQLYIGCRLDYRLRLWAAISALHAVSAIAEPLVIICRWHTDLHNDHIYL